MFEKLVKSGVIGVALLFMAALYPPARAEDEVKADEVKVEEVKVKLTPPENCRELPAVLVAARTL